MLMDFQTKEFKLFNMSSWNNLLAELEGSLHNCTWNNLNYYSAYNKIENISFVIFHENKLIALVPVAKNLTTKKVSFSFGNNLIFSPVFSPKIKQSLRKKVYDYFFELIKKKFKLKKLKIIFQSSPVYFKNKKVEICAKNQFELLSYSKSFNVHNTLILDLSEEEDQLLSNMSKYHRKNINKTSKIKNLKFEILNYKEKKDKIKEKFSEFKKYHRIRAGRVTRPKKTWEIMLKKIYDNEADLFYLNLDNKSISYLYCARLYDFAWGWSQVNLKKYENISPRHFLEWSVMKYYKRNQFHFYEIGERYYDQEKFKPSAKELSISDFKEKYGSDKYPKAFFRAEV
jgi:hypothetical protein